MSHVPKLLWFDEITILLHMKTLMASSKTKSHSKTGSFRSLHSQSKQDLIPEKTSVGSHQSMRALQPIAFRNRIRNIYIRYVVDIRRNSLSLLSYNLHRLKSIRTEASKSSYLFPIHKLRAGLITPTHEFLLLNLIVSNARGDLFHYSSIVDSRVYLYNKTMQDVTLHCSTRIHEPFLSRK